MKKILSILLFFLCVSPFGFAQEIKYVNSIGVGVLPGFLYGHTDDAKNLQAHTLGFELQFTRSKIENRTWTQGFKAPKIGWNLLYMDLGNPNLTGHALGIGPNFETAFKINKTSDFSCRMGTGFAYLSKKFDKFDNRRNMAIGSNINGIIQMLFLYNKNLPKTQFTVGFGLTHFSNASVLVPNLGVNMPSFYFSTHLKSKTINRTSFIADTMKDHRHTFYIAMARNERSLAKPHKFVIGHAAWLRQKRLTSVRSWHYGADIFLDKTHHFAEYPGQTLKGLSPEQMVELGVRAGYIWRISKVDLSTDIGLYLYKPSRNKAFTYQMIGIKYNLTDRFFLQSNLKIHYGTADFFEWGIGYNWDKRK